MLHAEIPHAGGPMYDQGNGWWYIPLWVTVPGVRPLDSWFVPLFMQTDGSRLLRIQVQQPDEIKEIKRPPLTFPEIASPVWRQSSDSQKDPPAQQVVTDVKLVHNENELDLEFETRSIPVA